MVGLVFMFGFGILFERLLAEPLMNRPGADLAVIITTLAGSILLVNAAQLIWGSRMKRLEPFIEGQVKLLGTNITAQDLIVILGAPLILILLSWILHNTRIGFAIRGVEQNRKSAELSGVNVRVIYFITFGISSCLAAIAGVMLGTSRFLVPTMGDTPLLKAFMVVILGGLGSLRGTILSAFIIGLIEAVSMSLINIYWTPAILFAIMIMVLVIKPTGISGEN
jgi:branched-chain amino acid transport system permease protein